MHAGRFSIVAVPIVAVPIFWFLSVTVLGRVGGAPAQGWGETPRVAVPLGGPLEAPGKRHYLLGVLLRMGMAPRRPSGDFVFWRIKAGISLKDVVKMHITASTNGKRHWFSRYACTAASRCNWSPRFVAASLRFATQRKIAC